MEGGEGLYMKKLGLIFLLLLLSIHPAMAADQMYSIIHEYQDALVVGEIVREIADSYKIDIKHVISGNLSQKTITLQKNFKYFTKDTPSVGDFVVLSLDKKVLNYYIKWGAFKVDSGEYKTLKLFKYGLSEGLQGDLTTLERYINSDTKDNDFYFDDQKVYLKKANGEVELIYPSEDLSRNQQRSSEVTTFSTATSNQEPVPAQHLVIVGGILLLGLVVVVIKHRQ